MPSDIQNVKMQSQYICENNKEGGSCDYISWNLPSKDKEKSENDSNKKKTHRSKKEKQA